MLLGIIAAWLVVNVLLVAFLLWHPLQHFSSAARVRSSRRATRPPKPRQRSMV